MTSPPSDPGTLKWCGRGSVYSLTGAGVTGSAQLIVGERFVVVRDPFFGRLLFFQSSVRYLRARAMTVFGQPIAVHIESDICRGPKVLTFVPNRPLHSGAALAAIEQELEEM